MFDTESGLYYNDNRYYTPSLGRWLSRDPLEEHGGAGLFTCMGNDSINRVDPWGLFASSIHRTITRSAIETLGITFRLAEYKDAIVEADVGVDSPLVHFFDPEYHAQNANWVAVVAGIMRNIKDQICTNDSDAKRLLFDIGTALHTLQDFYSHTDYIEGSRMIPVYRYYSDDARISAAKSHSPHGSPISIYNFPDPASFTYYEGGTKPWADDAHNRYAADDPTSGRSRAAPQGLGLSSFQSASYLAYLTTLDFLKGAKHNMKCSCRERIFKDKP
jgi:RHS repeat-associated protein